MTRLSMEQISRENQNCEESCVTSLSLSHRALSDVSCLSNFQNLERLDLSYNCLTSLEGLSACVKLKWLQVLENKLVTLKGIEGLSNLTVLNAGRNKLEKMDEICALSNLRALILNDNNISSICKLDQMKYLNTLVLSRNPIHVIGSSLKKVTSMTKLSLSHCKLQTIGLSLVGCVDLKEARFSHNEITALPEELAKNIKLRTLDVGNNLIEKLSEIKVLSTLHNLKNLNLLGNPIAEKEKLVNKVKRLVPNIRIFNAKLSESMALNVSEKVSLHPTKSDDSNRNKRESKQDDAFRRKRMNPSVEEIHTGENLFGNITDIGPERKKKLINSRTDVDISDTKISKNYIKNDYSNPSGTLINNVSVVKEIKKKLKSNTELLEKKTDAEKRNSTSAEENIDGKVDEKKPERKSSVVKVGPKFKDIDDEESPFVDLIFSGKTIKASESEKGRETINDAKLVQHSKKVKNRSKNKDSEFTALQLLYSAHEIGMGGQSTWDD